MWLPLPYLLASSCLGFLATFYAIPQCGAMFLKANIGGVDMGKRDKRRIPESGGVISGCIFLMITFVMIPVCYQGYLFNDKDKQGFPHAEFVQLIAALLSITCMLLLGFADDVLELR